MKTFLFICFFACIIAAQAQTATTPCSTPEAAQFDFWVGDWTATWSDTGHGTNHIEKMMGGCTIHEKFNDPKMKYNGESWSVYNPQTKLWQQTWVDDQGGYIALTGKWDAGQMILQTQERQTPKGPSISRMVYHNITADSFDWSWEASKDHGKTWTPSWQIHYTRKK